MLAAAMLSCRRRVAGSGRGTGGCHSEVGEHLVPIGHAALCLKAEHGSCPNNDCLKSACASQHLISKSKVILLSDLLPLNVRLYKKLGRKSDYLEAQIAQKYRPVLSKDSCEKCQSRYLKGSC